MGNFFKSLFSSSKEGKTENGNAEIAGTKIDQKNFDIFKYDGIRAQQIGKLQYAIKCFEEALNIQDDYETMGILVAAYLSAHQAEDALDVAHRMVELEPDNIASYLTRVNVLFMMDNEKDAIADCLKAIELEGENYIAWFMMGKAKRTEKDFEGAIHDLSRAIEFKDEFVSAWSLRAEILFETGMPEKALADIEKAIELAPEEESAYLTRGRIHEALNDLDAAIDDFNQALALNPFNEEASLLSASILILQEKPDEAIDILDEIIELKPDFGRAYMERSKAKKLKGDNEGAATDLASGEEYGAGSNGQGKESDDKPADFNEMYKGGIF